MYFFKFNLFTEQLIKNNVTAVVFSLTHCHKERLFLFSLIFNSTAQLNKESNYCPLLPDVVFNESIQSII